MFRQKLVIQKENGRSKINKTILDRKNEILERKILNFTVIHHTSLSFFFHLQKKNEIKYSVPLRIMKQKKNDNL